MIWNLMLSFTEDILTVQNCIVFCMIPNNMKGLFTLRLKEWNSRVYSTKKPFYINKKVFVAEFTSLWITHALQILGDFYW